MLSSHRNLQLNMLTATETFAITCPHFLMAEVDSYIMLLDYYRLTEKQWKWIPWRPRFFMESIWNVFYLGFSTSELATKTVDVTQTLSRVHCHEISLLAVHYIEISNGFQRCSFSQENANFNWSISETEGYIHVCTFGPNELLEINFGKAIIQQFTLAEKICVYCKEWRVFRMFGVETSCFGSAVMLTTKVWNICPQTTYVSVLSQDVIDYDVSSVRWEVIAVYTHNPHVMKGEWKGSRSEHDFKHFNKLQSVNRLRYREAPAPSVLAVNGVYAAIK